MTHSMYLTKQPIKILNNNKKKEGIKLMKKNCAMKIGTIKQSLGLFMDKLDY